MEWSHSNLMHKKRVCDIHVEVYASDDCFCLPKIEAVQVNKDQLVYCGEYLPAVVQCRGKEILGKAHWDRRLAWTSCHGKVIFSTFE